MTDARVTWAVVALAFAAFAALGALVANRPPTPLDVAASALTGHATAVAAFFTLLGRWYVLGAIGAAALLGGVALHAHARTIILVCIAQLASQAATAGVKELVRRPRPSDWILVHEPGFSYPSGHAVTTVVFYGVLLVLVVRGHLLPRPLVVPLAAALGVCIVGIPWSRIALGAHYATDVLGGLLFGLGWAGVTLVVIERLAPARP